MLLLQYFDAVGWVFWPVKPTTESENRLQLDSVSTSVNIDCLSMVDNKSAVVNDSRPWVVPQSIKWLSTIMKERRIPPDSESGGIAHLFGTSLSLPHIGSAWQARYDNNNKMLPSSFLPGLSTGRCHGLCADRRWTSPWRTSGSSSRPFWRSSWGEWSASLNSCLRISVPHFHSANPDYPPRYTSLPHPECTEGTPSCHTTTADTQHLSSVTRFKRHLSELLTARLGSPKVNFLGINKSSNAYVA